MISASSRKAPGEVYSKSGSDWPGPLSFSPPRAPAHAQAGVVSNQHGPPLDNRTVVTKTGVER